MALRCCVLLVCFAQEIFGCRTPACHWFYYAGELSQSCITNCLVYVLLLLKKPLCYSPLLSLSLHQTQLRVFNTHPSFHQFIFLVSYLFGALGGFSIQLSSHFSLCPVQPWWQTPCQPWALGQVPARPFLCAYAPVPPGSPGARGSCAHGVQEGSAGVRPSFAPRRGTCHTGSSSSPSVSCQEHRANLAALRKQTPPTQSSPC